MKTYETHIETTDPDYALTREFVANMAADGWFLGGCMVGRIPGSGETKPYAHYVFYKERVVS